MFLQWPFRMQMKEIRDREVIRGMWLLSKQRAFSTLIRSQQEHKRFIFWFKILILFLDRKTHLSDQLDYQIGLEILTPSLPVPTRALKIPRGLLAVSSTHLLLPSSTNPIQRLHVEVCTGTRTGLDDRRLTFIPRRPGELKTCSIIERLQKMCLCIQSWLQLTKPGPGPRQLHPRSKCSYSHPLSGG